MYSKEIIDAIFMSHKYEYCIVNSHFEIVKYSDNFVTFCDKNTLQGVTPNLFDVVMEFVGMEETLLNVLEGNSKELLLPLVFKEPNNYVNIRVCSTLESGTLIVLFEEITEITEAQQYSQQVHNENLLLVDEVEEKNKQLEIFNHEMQRLVDEEVAKNLEQQHMMQLQTRHAQMGEMIAMITHQWKQPLSVIRAVSSLLKIKYELGTLSQTLFTQKIDNLLNQVTYMNQTVNDFQRFFMPSKEQSLFDIKETISSVLNLVKMEYSHQNINIELIEENKMSVFGYANEFNQVILAILENAKDALIECQQVKKYIIIRISTSSKRTLITIDDNAGGISIEIIDTLFSQYVTTKEKGSGLGLYIAKTIVEKNMQGELRVTNSDVGAQFSILL